MAPSLAGGHRRCYRCSPRSKFNPTHPFVEEVGFFPWKISLPNIIFPISMKCTPLKQSGHQLYQKRPNYQKWSKYFNHWNTWRQVFQWYFNKSWVACMSWDASQLADCVNVWLFTSLPGQTALHVFFSFFSSLLLLPLSFLLLIHVLGLTVGGCGSTRTCQRHRLIFPWSSSSSRARARLPPFAAAPPPEPESSNPLTVHMLTAPCLQLFLGRNGDKTDVIQHQIGQVWPDRAVIRVTETTPWNNWRKTQRSDHLNWPEDTSCHFDAKIRMSEVFVKLRSF